MAKLEIEPTQLSQLNLINNMKEHSFAFVDLLPNYSDKNWTLEILKSLASLNDTIILMEQNNQNKPYYMGDFNINFQNRNTISCNNFFTFTDFVTEIDSLSETDNENDYTVRGIIRSTSTDFSNVQENTLDDIKDIKVVRENEMLIKRIVNLNELEISHELLNTSSNSMSINSKANNFTLNNCKIDGDLLNADETESNRNKDNKKKIIYISSKGNDVNINHDDKLLSLRKHVEINEQQLSGNNISPFNIEFKISNSNTEVERSLINDITNFVLIYYTYNIIEYNGIEHVDFTDIMNNVVIKTNTANCQEFIVAYLKNISEIISIIGNFDMILYCKIYTNVFTFSNDNIEYMYNKEEFSNSKEMNETNFVWNRYCELNTFPQQKNKPFNLSSIITYSNMHEITNSNVNTHAYSSKNINQSVCENPADNTLHVGNPYTSLNLFVYSTSNKKRNTNFNNLFSISKNFPITVSYSFITYHQQQKLLSVNFSNVNEVGENGKECISETIEIYHFKKTLRDIPSFSVSYVDDLRTKFMLSAYYTLGNIIYFIYLSDNLSIKCEVMCHCHNACGSAQLSNLTINFVKSLNINMNNVLEIIGSSLDKPKSYDSNVATSFHYKTFGECFPFLNRIVNTLFLLACYVSSKTYITSIRYIGNLNAFRRKCIGFRIESMRGKRYVILYFLIKKELLKSLYRKVTLIRIGYPYDLQMIAVVKDQRGILYEQFCIDNTVFMYRVIESIISQIYIKEKILSELNVLLLRNNKKVKESFFEIKKYVKNNSNHYSTTNKNMKSDINPGNERNVKFKETRSVPFFYSGKEIMLFEFHFFKGRNIDAKNYEKEADAEDRNKENGNNTGNEKIPEKNEDKTIKKNTRENNLNGNNDRGKGVSEGDNGNESDEEKKDEDKSDESNNYDDKSDDETEKKKKLEKLKKELEENEESSEGIDAHIDFLESLNEAFSTSDDTAANNNVKEAEAKKENTQHMKEKEKEGKGEDKKAKRINEADKEIERILKNKNGTPVEVFDIKGNIIMEEVKSKFKKLSVLIHPDKCKNENAGEAFNIIKVAYEELCKEDFREEYKFFYEIALKNVRKRSKEYKNKKTDEDFMVKFLNKRPKYEETEEEHKLVVEECKRIMNELKEKREYAEKCKMSNLQHIQEMEEEKMKEEMLKEKERKMWEETKDQRINNWIKYKEKKNADTKEFHLFKNVSSKKEKRVGTQDQQDKNNENKIEDLRKKSDEKINQLNDDRKKRQMDNTINESGEIETK